MITLRGSVSFLLLAAGTLHGQVTDFRVDGRRAGGFEIGLPIDSVYALVGTNRTRLVDLYYENHFTPALEIRLAGSTLSKALVVQIREAPCPGFAISGIEVFDRRFRTAEGLGVGSTMGELRRAYTFRWSHEGGTPHAWIEKRGLSFQFGSMSEADSVKVVSIWIPGDPEVVRKKWCPTRGFDAFHDR